MSQNGGIENFSTCPICCEQMTLENLSLINCGHVYHFECIQNMYEFDHRNGNKSACTICRKHVTCKPNRVYGNYPKENISYFIPSNTVQPNITGKKQKTSNSINSNSNTANGNTRSSTRNHDQNYMEISSDDNESDNNEELIGFYEDRLADLERQLEGFRDLRRDHENVLQELSRTRSQLNVAKTELDGRNAKIAKVLGETVHLKEKIKELELKYQAAEHELGSYQHCKIALETDRLANEINRLQSESYYKNLLKDPSMTREQLILLVAGIKIKYTESEMSKMEMERELRSLRVFKERTEKENKRNIRQTREPIEIVDSNDETELENDNLVFDDDDETDLETEPAPFNPFKKQTVNSTLVPKSIPKQLKSQYSSSSTTATGTGKRSKVMEFGSGKQFLT